MRIARAEIMRQCDLPIEDGPNRHVARKKTERSAPAIRCHRFNKFLHDFMPADIDRVEVFRVCSIGLAAGSAESDPVLHLRSDPMQDHTYQRVTAPETR